MSICEWIHPRQPLKLELSLNVNRDLRSTKVRLLIWEFLPWPSEPGLHQPSAPSPPSAPRWDCQSPQNRSLQNKKFSFNKSHKTCVERVLPFPISPLHLLVVLSRMALVDTIFPYLKNSSVYTRLLCADNIYPFMLTISTETQRANLNSWARAGAWRRMKTSDNEAEREGYRTQIK